MTLSPEIRAEISHLFYAKHLSMNAIAETLRIHHDSVKAALNPNRFSPLRKDEKLSLIEPYVGMIDDLLKEYPRLRSTRILKIIKEKGFTGGIDIVRRRVKNLRRESLSRAFIPVTVYPGEQGQVDWASFGKIPVENMTRKLSCFVMVLSYSRAIFARFTLDQTMESFLRSHVEAFRFFGGSPVRLLYDNLKSVVIDRFGKHIHFNPTHLDFSAFYHFKPEACNPASGWEKGRVERAIRYIRDGFFAGRSFKDLETLNRDMREWLKKDSMERPWPDDKSKSVGAVFEEERPKLLALPEHDFYCDAVVAVCARKYPYVRFDLNDYSIPYDLVGKPLTLVSSEKKVKIYDDRTEVACHARSWGKGVRVNHDSHFARVFAESPRARTMSYQEKIITFIPEARDFFALLSKFNLPLGSNVRRLYDLVENYGPADVGKALKEAVKNEMPRASAVAQILYQMKDKTKERPGLPLKLPARIAEITIPEPDLAGYDSLRREGDYRDDE